MHNDTKEDYGKRQAALPIRPIERICEIVRQLSHADWRFSRTIGILRGLGRENDMRILALAMLQMARQVLRMRRRLVQ